MQERTTPSCPGVWTFCGQSLTFLYRKLYRKLCRMLTHHRLKVYEKALALGAEAQELSAPWGRRHAIVEHFRRASESIVLNIAEWARLVSPQKVLGGRVETTQEREFLSRIVPC